MTDRPACAETRQLLPELAAGIAAPEERAGALRHLAGCGRCHRELEAQTALVDELLQLVPEMQPPAGFEAAALAPTRNRRRPHRLRTTVLLAASAALIAGATGGAVWQQTESDRQLAGKYRQTLAVANGQYLRTVPVNGTSTTPSGYVFAYQGSPAWLFVTMTAVSRPGDYRISLVSRDGREFGLGTMTVQGDRGSWGKTIPVAVHDILVIRFHGPPGHELLARFT
ncbi:zf-HC2 domain-containing protein [Spirillospora sp. NPDC048819]|uniref:zf-HC2 domain-containing protein n=1 Tax=Spirillospora sp. NPDC048819 TaxID=3155268 RepID=UPI0033EC3B92